MTAPSLLSLFSADLAIDLGTANTLVFERNKGIVVNEPSIVAMRRKTGDVEAVGSEAREMLGRTPDQITAIKPMRNGVIADFEATSHMLGHFIHKARRYKRLVHPRIVIGVPSEITPVERRAVKEACAKASEVHMVQQPVMAAVGAGLPIAEPVGSLIVDIGGGTTDVAVISLAGVVYAHSVRVAGNAMDEMIIDHVKRRHNLLIGEQSAEAVKIQIGSALPLANEMRMEVRGRDLVRGIPGAATVTDSEIRDALSGCVGSIVNAIRQALEQTPPELSGDIFDHGVVLTGGGALLKNLDARISRETGLPVLIADDPLLSVVLGAGRMLDDFRLLRRVSMN
ncbi:MAG TPA: rod shape-determining protein [Candidatus Acidoferrales bacterium]|nr:rod shape-determining protein [Candidatus Acidoferrales bacterium]HXK06376.1 rod shape-determining protein [Verrucomicrobiae bacterium]